jgi:predicted kinase
MKDLILLRGVPGSGKTTFAESLIRGRDAVHCEADQSFIDEAGVYRFDPTRLREAHEECQAKCRQAMEDGCELIIVSNTFTMEWELEQYLEFAREYDYRTFSIIVENRHGGDNIHGCPPEKVDVMRARFEVKI